LKQVNAQFANQALKLVMMHVSKILADVCLETKMEYANNAVLEQLLTSRENVLVLQTA
jgi:hypothetical protein